MHKETLTVNTTTHTFFNNRGAFAGTKHKDITLIKAKEINLERKIPDAASNNQTN